VKRERRNGSSVCVDPLSKSINHTPRIDVYDVWEYERVWGMKSSDLDLKRMAKVDFHKICPCLL
jgi:hypothetical protein